jgi:alkanesulfonate monooxygenase SsuD/methylene tetrahydromethanopterin reductase-like flavin-dependent oxidoreductase (luciferase family)
MLFGGRVFPAVGVGVSDPREWRAAGVAAAHRARTEEALELLRRLWRDDEVTVIPEFHTR